MPADSPFFTTLPPTLCSASSGARELAAILYMLRSIPGPVPARIVVFTDSAVARDTIRRGSKNALLQSFARRIFEWCIQHSAVLAVCWVPRSAPILKEADARSRWRDVHDQRTPTNVVAAADRLATQLWSRPLSFDRMATNLNAVVSPSTRVRLPFNSRWLQPGSSGVNVFVQPPSEWAQHINFLHPPTPMIGRVLSFLPATRSRSIVVFPETVGRGHWWSPWTQLGQHGVVATSVTCGFVLLAVDHRRRHPPP